MSNPGRREPGLPIRRNSALDRPAARVGAFLVFLSAAAALAWIHRDDLLPNQAAVAANDPVAKCLAARTADIDKMQQDGVVDAGRATLFKNRAEALCQAQFGQGGGPPTLPK